MMTRDLIDKTSKRELLLCVCSYLSFSYRWDKADIFYVFCIFQTRHTKALLSYVTIDYLPYFVFTLQGSIRVPEVFSVGLGNNQ